MLLDVFNTVNFGKCPVPLENRSILLVAAIETIACLLRYTLFTLDL
jgi:hypothetical protein